MQGRVDPQHAGGDVDGLLNLGVPLDEKIGERLRRRLPTVLLDTRYPGLPDISVDDHEGGRMAAEHLAALGHRTVAFLNEVETYPFQSPPVLRLAGLLSVLGDGAVVEITVPRERGVDVPGDVSVVGFDDDLVAEALGLSTVRHPFEESGRLALRTLRRMLAAPGVPMPAHSAPACRAGKPCFAFKMVTLRATVALSVTSFTRR